MLINPVKFCVFVMLIRYILKFVQKSSVSLLCNYSLSQPKLCPFGNFKLSCVFTAVFFLLVIVFQIQRFALEAIVKLIAVEVKMHLEESATTKSNQFVHFIPVIHKTVTIYWYTLFKPLQNTSLYILYFFQFLNY